MKYALRPVRRKPARRAEMLDETIPAVGFTGFMPALKDSYAKNRAEAMNARSSPSLYLETASPSLLKPWASRSVKGSSKRRWPVATSKPPKTPR
jgi:hypothetical protein